MEAINMGFSEYMNKFGSDIKMGLHQGKIEEALKLVFTAGFANGVEFETRIRQQEYVEEL
mgnify:CR=1 FL=1